MDKQTIKKPSLWRSAFKEAWRTTREALGLSGSSLVIATLLLAIYLVLVWRLGGSTMARDEVILRACASAAPIALIPVVWVWKIFAAINNTHRELIEKVNALTELIEGSHKIVTTIIQNETELLLRIENLGPQFAVDVRLDYSETGIAEVFHVMPMAHWLDGFSANSRFLSEGEHNTALIRTITPVGGFMKEDFHGEIGIQDQTWSVTDWHFLMDIPPPKRRISILITTSPRLPGGINKVVLEVCGNDIDIVAGEAKLVRSETSTGPIVSNLPTPTLPAPPATK